MLITSDARVSLEMSPPPLAALALLGIWVILLFAVTHAAAYDQWRADGASSVPDADHSGSTDGFGPVSDD